MALWLLALLSAFLSIGYSDKTQNCIGQELAWPYKVFIRCYGWHFGSRELRCIFRWVSTDILRVPFLRDWTWTAQVFLTLHTLVLLMKMHSYSFYNGHLSETERRLRALDEPSTASKAPVYLYPPARDTPLLGEKETDKSDSDENSQLCRLREDLAMELTSPMGSVTYPKNLTLYNYVD